MRILVLEKHHYIEENYIFCENSLKTTQNQKIFLLWINKNKFIRKSLLYVYSEKLGVVFHEF
jgi:hypothetical protein